MTNEEILAAVAQTYGSIEPDTDLHNCIRELIVQAYEEAAQIADQEARLSILARANREVLGDVYSAMGEQSTLIAKGIRDLKDSLVAEKVSS